MMELWRALEGGEGEKVGNQERQPEEETVCIF